MEEKQVLEVTEQEFQKQISSMIEILNNAKFDDGNDYMVATGIGGKNQILMLGRTFWAAQLCVKLITKIACCSNVEAMYIITELMDMLEIKPSRLIDVLEQKAKFDKDREPEEALKQIKEILNEK